ncbi:MAG: hypothetical protein II369_04180, partial [Clostridia bacterium]|nr:hypothetical protein [Clostridia bacterium]
MKKNKMMRIASFLLVAVLMSTCAISGTFAKYVTADTATDSARVAKWGVTIDISSYKAFEKSYQNPEGTATTVQADVKVVAPGTTGTLVNSTISGTPEVSVNVSFAATLTLEGWTLANGEEYCPIVFKVGSETYSLAG